MPGSDAPAHGEAFNAACHVVENTPPDGDEDDDDEEENDAAPAAGV